MQLRPYQREAVDAVYGYLRSQDGNPCVVIPTGGGKTPVIATVCRDAVNLWNGRVIVLAHVKELLEQAREKLECVAPDLDVGIYSAGLGHRDTEHSIIIAGIQSVYKRARELGLFHLIIVDEAHLIPPDGEGMYRQFIAEMKSVNPEVRVIGLTATPFRMKSGMICAPENILNEVCFDVGVKELIVLGYLCPLRSKAGRVKADTSGLHLRAGEFIAGEVEDLMDDDQLVTSACSEIVELTADRKSVLIFTSGVRHGRHVADVMRERHGIECGFVCGDTLPYDRDETLDRFRNGDLKYLANVNVLTTGFDAPNIDCVALLRPTMSPGLYYQMVGRGFRTHESKEDCLVLDYGGNVLRHGPVDAIRLSDPEYDFAQSPAKKCPQCRALIHSAYAICPDCGFAFPPKSSDEHDRRKHESTASTEGILSGQKTRTVESVSEIMYSVHEKRDAPPDAPRSMRVEYRIGFNRYISEWICVEHSGYARVKAEDWWYARSKEPVPDTAEEAVALAEQGVLAEPTAITIEHTAGERYDRIIDYELPGKPASLDDELPEYVIPDDEVPF